MRVTHVINLAESPGSIPFAGAEHHLFLLMREQVRAGCVVEFAPLVFSSGPLLERTFQDLHHAGLIVTPLYFKKPLRRLLMPMLILKMIPFFRSRRRNIIHTHLDLADFTARLAAYLAGCRYVVNTVHNDEPHYKLPIWRLQLRLLSRTTRHTIAISRHVRNYLISVVGLTPENITVVPYGIAPPLTTLSRMRARQLLHVAEQHFVVGFVGRFEEQKQPLFFLQAIAHMADVHAVMIGDGSMHKSIVEAARALPPDKVTILGYHPDAAELMSGFDLFCLPSRWEGLGLVLLEAMIRGIPVLGSTAGAIPEVLGYGQYGLLFHTGNLEELQVQIQNAKENPSLVKTMAQEAQRWVRESFSVQRMATSTIGIYQRACVSSSEKV